MHRIALACLVLAWSLRSARADTPDPKAATDEAAAGGKLYQDGNYHDAAAKFAHAYDLDPQPAYLFNAAQAYRFAKECASAAKYYHQFYDIAKQAQAQNLDKVKQYMAEMDLCAKARKDSLEPAKPDKPVEPAHGEPAAAPPHAELPPQEPVAAPAERGEPGATQRHIGLGLGAVGLVGIAAGVFYTIKVEGDGITCSPTQLCTKTQISDANSKGTSDEHMEIAAYAIGSAALAGGIVLYMLGKSRGDEHAVTIAPMNNGAMLSWRF